MPVLTKRWNDPIEPGDGFRVLVCRHRPRGVPAASAPWDAWSKELAPSAPLVASFYDENAPMAWENYAARYLEEMRAAGFWLAAYRGRVAAGETITLLCSSACTDPARCHRTLLKGLIENPPRTPLTPGFVRRPAGR